MVSVTCDVMLRDKKGHSASLDLSRKKLQFIHKNMIMPSASGVYIAIHSKVYVCFVSCSDFDIQSFVKSSTNFHGRVLTEKPVCTYDHTGRSMWHTV